VSLGKETNVKFQLTKEDKQGNKTGLHRVGNQRYRAGDVLETDLPLDKLFRNKFERVSEATPVSEPEIVRTIRVAGVPAEAPAIPKPESVKQDDAIETTEASRPKKSDKSPHGKDVTDEFPEAELLKLAVYHDKKSTKYTVVDVEEGDVVVKVSKSKVNISKFLARQMD